MNVRFHKINLESSNFDDMFYSILPKERERKGLVKIPRMSFFHKKKLGPGFKSYNKKFKFSIAKF